VIVLRSRGQARSLLRQMATRSAAQVDPQYVGLQPR